MFKKRKMAKKSKLEDAESKENEAAPEQPANEDENDLQEVTPDLERAARIRKFILIGVFVGLILIALTLIIVSVVSRASGCSLIKGEPSYLSPPRTVWPEHDATKMAKLAGYIHVYDSGFLPLDIKYMSLSGPSELISLEDDCVGVSLAHHINADGLRTVSLDHLEWFFTDTTPISNQSHDACHVIEPVFYSRYPTKYRYSCLERQVFQCQRLREDGELVTVSELVLESLELELDGNDELIKKGRFSKPPYAESCSSQG